MNSLTFPCQWIAHPGFDAGRGGVFAYRLQVDVHRHEKVLFHVSADERFEIYVDGRFIGDGPHRGDPDHWCYHTLELDLSPGRHVLVARCWWIGPTVWAPFAQLSVRHGFVAWADTDPDRFNTGHAGWTCTRVEGCEWLPSGVAWGSGAKLRLDGRTYPWDVESGRDDLDWVAPTAIGPATTSVFHKTGELHGRWALVPTSLPPMVRERAPAPRVRHVAAIVAEPTEPVPFAVADHLAHEASAWETMLQGGQAVQLAPHTRRRVLLDADDYRCAFPEMVLRSGTGSRVRIRWAESLFLEAQPKPVWPFGKPKGHRDRIEGKFFHGVGDEFISAGGDLPRTYRTLWWEAGRYVELVIETGDAPLIIDAMQFIETRYPMNIEASFESDDIQHQHIQRLGTRSLLMCSHETHMDCPYYEQLQYVGDTRLQSLTAFVLSRDPRLQRRAVELFDQSRLPSGLTQSRYPSRSPQVIPPFSLLWVGMVHDYWRWRGDEPFIRERLGGVRAVLDAHLRRINRDGLLEALPGWNFIDWVPRWKGGMPPGAEIGMNSSVAMLAVLALQQAADLEHELGLTELSHLYSNSAKRLFAATMERMWSPQRNLLGDELGNVSFSEHAQALALLTNLATSKQRAAMLDALTGQADLSHATVYFSHYVLDALLLCRRPGAMLNRLGLWEAMAELGLHTTIETPEPARSDCHAWGAHPIYHFYAGILGVRPAVPGFAKVQIAPQLGGLNRASGRTVHPTGIVAVSLQRNDRRIIADIQLPDNLSGTLFDGTRDHPLVPGRQSIEWQE